MLIKMKLEIKQLLFLNSFFAFGINLFAPLYAIYVQHIDSSIIHVGAIWTVYIFSVGIFALLFTKVKNRSSYSGLFLILGFLFRAIGWLGYIFATSIWHLYLIQLLLAAGEAFGTPAYNHLYSSFLDKMQHGSEWNISTSINSFIVGTASFVGVVIVDKFGFPALFGCMIVLSFVSTLLALRYKKIFWQSS